MNTKKRILLFFGFLLTMIAAKADEVNFTVPDFTIQPGETKEISLVMTSSSDDMKFNFNGEILLGEGLTFVSEEIYDEDEEENVTTWVFRTNRLHNKHEINANLLASNNIKFLVNGGTSFYKFKAGEAVIIFKVKASESIALTPTTVQIKNMSAAGEAAVELVPSDKRSYTATVTISKKCNISVSSADENKGTVTGEGGVYDSGTQVTVTATPVGGYQFVNWTSGETAVSTDNPYVFTVAGDINLVANFAPITYNIAYELNGGALAEGKTNAATYTIESEAITLNNPSKTAYDFAGWTGTGLTTASANVTIAKGSTGDRSYTATWTPIAYAISYNLAGGSVAKTNATTYTIESDAITLTNPTREGYTFAGWTGTELTGTVETVTIAKGSIGARSYTATWTINQYTMTFVLSNGEDNVVKTQDYNSALEAPVPTKTGYTFKGWDATVPSTVPAENKTFTAQWEATSYAITYDLDGGALAEGASNPASYTIESETITLANPTKTGYTFAGWTGTELTDTVESVTIAKGSTGARSFKAAWTINQYLMTFVLGNGEDNIVKTQDYNSALEAPVPTKTGYTFKGWDATVPSTVPAENKTFTAQWEATSYAITYDLDGGALAEGASNPAGYTIESETITLANPTKTGYTFAGWTGTELTDTVEAVTIAKGSTGARSFKATWTINQYTMTFVLGNGEDNVVKTQDYNSALEAPVPTKTGYTFKGWDAAVPATVPAENKTFTAQWERNSYKVTWIVDGNITEDSLAFEGTITKPIDPVKEGYTFTGWDADIPATMPAENLTFNAKWQVIGYSISYAGVEIKEAKGVYALQVGDSFTSGQVVEVKDDNQVLAATITYGEAGGKDFAAAVADSHIDGFVATTAGNGENGNKIGGTFYTIVPQISGEIEIGVVLNAGKSFYILEDGTALADYDGIKVAEKYYGTYKFQAQANKSYKFYCDGSKLGFYGFKYILVDSENPMSYNIESESFTLVNPTKENYDFAGWTGTGLTEASTEVTITKGSTGDRTYTATWTATPFSITYDLDGGALAEGVSNPATYTVESETITLAIPTKTGYTFAGWTGTELTDTVEAVTIAKGSTGARSFKATWTINQYTMTFVLGNGEDNVVKTQDYNSALEAPVPTKTGYTFKGWDAAVPATVPAENKTFTAQWERNSYKVIWNVDGNITEDSVAFEGTITKPIDPVKEGYTFTGWDAEIPNQMPANDLTFTAQWKVNTYAIIYMVNDEEWARDSVAYGETIVKKNFSLEGYVFEGWTSDAEYTTMPAHDVVYTATLTPTGIMRVLGDDAVVNIYKMDGTLVGRNVNVKELQRRLTKGVYIINGKKFSVK